MLKFSFNTEESEMNVIPLINVIFVVLIFFLVLYRFSTFDSENINTESSSEETESKEDTALQIYNNSFVNNGDKSVIIEVTADGRVYISGREVNNSLSEFKDLITSPKNTTVLLSINRDSPYKVFGKIMLNLKRVGIDKIKFLDK